MRRLKDSLRDNVGLIVVIVGVVLLLAGTALLIAGPFMKSRLQEYVNNLEIELIAGEYSGDMVVSYNGTSVKLNEKYYIKFSYYMTADPGLTFKDGNLDEEPITVKLGESDYVYAYPTDDPNKMIVYFEIEGKERRIAAHATNIWFNLTNAVDEDGFGMRDMDGNLYLNTVLVQP
ncbi:MAG TPA: hypothetical protein P5116_02365 [Eubacteriales bacterium]|nr:hypothetical protein [Clostridia bacterium]HRV72707.1 hypothetical protein [Eubacteriales bacterium]